MPAKFAAVVVSQPMMDDQKTVIHWLPQEADGTPGAIPPGATAPVTAIAPGTALQLDPAFTPDPTGLNVGVQGLKGKGQSGTEKVTVSFTNADGSVATGEVDFPMTTDPAELDVAGFGAIVDTPVSQ